MVLAVAEALATSLPTAAAGPVAYAACLKTLTGFSAIASWWSGAGAVGSTVAATVGECQWVAGSASGSAFTGRRGLEGTGSNNTGNNTLYHAPVWLYLQLL